MAGAALHKVWREWCSFADGLDLSPRSPDCATLHGRLFRLSGSHPLRARDLRPARDAIRAAFEPWLGEGAREPADELERLRQAMRFCEPGWRALLGAEGRQIDWREVERVALAAGLVRSKGL